MAEASSPRTDDLAVLAGCLPPRFPAEVRAAITPVEGLGGWATATYPLEGEVEEPPVTASRVASALASLDALNALVAKAIAEAA